MNPPKPTALKILQGNPGKRALNDAEPKPAEIESDDPPTFLLEMDDAVSFWRETLPILKRMRVMTEADYGVLVEMALAYARMRQALSDVRSEGLTVSTLKGGVMKNPAVGVLEDAQKQLLAYRREFGLTPAARTRVKTSSPQKDKQESPWEELQRGRTADSRGAFIGAELYRVSYRAGQSGLANGLGQIERMNKWN